MASTVHRGTSRGPAAPDDAWGRRCLRPTAHAELLLTRCVDAGLAGVLLTVPLIMGGRIALGQLVLVVLSLGIAICWCARQGLSGRAPWVPALATKLVILAMIFVGFQLVPLPSWLLCALSPRLRETLPLWMPGPDGSVALGTWATLSLAPTATRTGLILLASFTLLFVTTLQRVRQIEDVERLLGWIAVSTVIMAVLGLAQYLAGNGKFFWFYEHPFTDTARVVKGSFSNRNHFAEFMALGLGPLLWWLESTLLRSSAPNSRAAGGGQSHFLGVRRENRDSPRERLPDFQVGLWGVAMAGCILATLLSLSRGGTVAVVVAASVCVMVFRRAGLVGRKTLLSVLGFGALVGIFLAVHGYDMVTARLGSLNSLETLGAEGRLQLWRAESAAVADYFLTGTGLASHGDVSPIYFQNTATAEGTEYTHAENGPLQVAMEGGIPGLLLALTAVGLCVYWCLAAMRACRSTRTLICLAAIAASLAANFVHSLADFVWYVPGCMVVVVVLAACACRLWQLSRASGGETPEGEPDQRWIPRAGWLTAACCLILVGYFMVHNRLMATLAEPFWNRYLALNCRVASLDPAEQPEALGAMEDALSSTLRWQSDHGRAHARLAEIHLMRFNAADDTSPNPMDVRQVCDAALHSSFPSSEAMQAWLGKAFGERSRRLGAARHHARQAVALCPLQGEAYLTLAEVCFLDGPRSPGKAAYVDQAMRVRPGDGSVLFVAGQECMFAGDPEKAVEYWRRSARAGGINQTRLLKLLAPHLPVEAVLEIVHPDRAGLKQMTRSYGRPEQRESLLAVHARLAAISESEAATLQGSPATECWLDAARAHRALGQLPDALRCLRQALAGDVSHYETRHALARCLLDVEQFDEAEEHLHWCLQRKPQDAGLSKEMASAVEGRLRMTSLPARPAKSQDRRQ